jgi:hypothetical protein
MIVPHHSDTSDLLRSAISPMSSQPQFSQCLFGLQVAREPKTLAEPVPPLVRGVFESLALTCFWDPVERVVRIGVN